MATFKEDTVRDEWEIYELFRDGPITLFYKPQVLEDALGILLKKKYEAHEFDCKNYSSDTDIYNDILIRLGIIDAEYKNMNFIQFWDLFAEATVPEDTGMVLVFNSFDSLLNISPEIPKMVFNLISGYHYKFLLFGKKFKSFVQVDNPEMEYQVNNIFMPKWNHKERDKKSRL
jgi:hypothetical protein